MKIIIRFLSFLFVSSTKCQNLRHNLCYFIEILSIKCHENIFTIFQGPKRSLQQSKNIEFTVI